MIMLGVVYAAVTGNLSAVTDAAFDSAGEAISLCITMAGVMAFWMGLMEIAGESGMIAKMTKGISPFLSFLFPRIPKGHAAREYIATNIIANILGLGWACTPAGLKAMEALSRLQEERGDPAYRGITANIEGSVTGSRASAKGGGSSTDGRSAVRGGGSSTDSRVVARGNGSSTDGRAVARGSGNGIDGRAAAAVMSGNTNRVEKTGKIAGNRAASNEMCTFLIINISSLQLIPVNMIAYRRQYGSVEPASIILPAIIATFCSTVVAIIYCKIKDRSVR
jgi:spore maturation protein A